MTVGGRILITSKRPIEVQPLRKPIHGCYCNLAQKNYLKQTKTVNKSSWPCEYCKSRFEIQFHEVGDQIVTPPLSCDVLNKVQRIDYTPRSEFLRRVQKKVDKSIKISRSHSEPSAKSSRIPRETSRIHQENYEDGEVYREHEENQENVVVEEIHEPEIQTIYSPKATLTSTSSRTISKKTFSSPRSVGKEALKSCSTRTLTKKTICSRSAGNDIGKTISKPITSKIKPISRTLTQKSCHFECCPLNARSKLSKKTGKTNETCPQCSRSCPSRFLTAAALTKSHEDVDNDVIKLRKFREINYFDTHGSKNTLFSTASEESLQQYQLNDRLFPESVAKIHRGELVVSMPSCATKQFKRIHYFPRHIVKQDERAAALTDKKKKRYESCPLIGHAIDLNVLKVPPPSNSLALKFQKRIR